MPAGRIGIPVAVARTERVKLSELVMVWVEPPLIPPTATCAKVALGPRGLTNPWLGLACGIPRFGCTIPGSGIPRGIWPSWDRTADPATIAWCSWCSWCCCWPAPDRVGLPPPWIELRRFCDISPDYKYRADIQTTILCSSVNNFWTVLSRIPSRPYVPIAIDVTRYFRQRLLTLWYFSLLRQICWW